jgi:hypothetical protein
VVRQIRWLPQAVTISYFSDGELLAATPKFEELRS